MATNLSRLRELTEKMNREERENESRQRLRIIFEESPIGMMLVDKDYQFLNANRAACELTGYSEGELMQLKFTDVTHPDDIAENVRLAEAMRDGAIDDFQLYTRYVRADKTSVPCMLTVKAVRDTKGGFLYGLRILSKAETQWPNPSTCAASAS